MNIGYSMQNYVGDYSIDFIFDVYQSFLYFKSLLISQKCKIDNNKSLMKILHRTKGIHEGFPQHWSDS